MVDNNLQVVILLYLDSKPTYKQKYHESEAIVLSKPNKGGYVSVQVIDHNVVIPWRSNHWKDLAGGCLARKKSDKNNNNNNNKNENHLVSQTNKDPSDVDIVAQFGEMSINDKTTTIGGEQDSNRRRSSLNLESRYYVYCAVDVGFLLQNSSDQEGGSNSSGSSSSTDYPNIDLFKDSLLYIGKGVGDRMTNHYSLACNLDDEKSFYIRVRKLWSEKNIVHLFKIVEDLEEDYAFDVESVMIESLKQCCPDRNLCSDSSNRQYLMNSVKGRKIEATGCQIEELKEIMRDLAYSMFLKQWPDMRTLKFKEPTLCHNGAPQKAKTTNRKLHDHKSTSKRIRLPIEQLLTILHAKRMVTNNSKDPERKHSGDNACCYSKEKSTCESEIIDTGETQDDNNDTLSDRRYSRLGNHCPVCRRRVVLTMSELCSNCQNMTCREHTISCHICEITFCNLCTRECICCGKICCDEHYSEENESCHNCMQ